jgi:hypothetical protein
MAHLSRLLARRPDGIFISPFEQGEIGPDPFRKACEFGLDPLPDGGQLRTLLDAGRYVEALPKAVHDRSEWQKRPSLC